MFYSSRSDHSRRLIPRHTEAPLAWGTFALLRLEAAFLQPCSCYLHLTGLLENCFSGSSREYSFFCSRYRDVFNRSV